VWGGAWAGGGVGWEWVVRPIMGGGVGHEPARRLSSRTLAAWNKDEACGVLLWPAAVLGVPLLTRSYHFRHAARAHAGGLTWRRTWGTARRPCASTGG